MGYYRRFLKEYGVIGVPLNDLLITGHQTGPKIYNKPRTRVVWNKEKQIAFDTIIDSLINPLVQRCAFEHNTDASSNELGAVVYLEHEGIWYQYVQTTSPRLEGLGETGSLRHHNRQSHQSSCISIRRLQALV